MKASIVRAAIAFLALLLAMPISLFGQVPPSAPPVQGVPLLNHARLDQLLAPIALYPDPLLAQILMAATYPIEVVEAARWLQDQGNTQLHGDQLDAALQQQNWDPSVKSLVPFPQILQMMNSKLEWTEALGNAFLAQQSDVMDSVQRLRAEAVAAGTLRSNAQETVSTAGQIITIEPANPQVIYVPYYDPSLVYGAWGYPDYPPVDFPPPPNYGYVMGPGIYFGFGFAIIDALWGWDDWDWGHREIVINPDRYNRINRYAIGHNNRAPYTANTWQHNPADRRGVPYGNPAVRQKFQPAPAGSPEQRRDFRGFDNRGGTPAGPTPSSNARAVTPPPVQRAPAIIGGAPSLPAVPRSAPPAFSSFGRGPDVRAESQRGQASRQSMAPAPAPRAAAPQQRSAPPSQPQRSAPERGGQNGRRP